MFHSLDSRHLGCVSINRCLLDISCRFNKWNELCCADVESVYDQQIQRERQIQQSKEKQQSINTLTHEGQRISAAFFTCSRTNHQTLCWNCVETVSHEESSLVYMCGSHCEARRRRCDGVWGALLYQHGNQNILQRLAIPSALCFVGPSLVFHQENDPKVFNIRMISFKQDTTLLDHHVWYVYCRCLCV